MPNLTNFGKLAGMTFQVMQPTKMDFAGLEATQMMHDFKFEPNRSTLRYLAEDSKIWKPYTGPAAELLIWSRLRYEMIDPESNNQLAVI